VQLKLELAHDFAEIVGLPRVEKQQGARFVDVEALELAVVQAVGELLVNEERKASRAPRENLGGWIDCAASETRGRP
jgi:hypothetical protein